MTSSSITHRAPRQIVAGDSIEFLVAIPDDCVGRAGNARLSGAAAMAATSCVTEGSDYHVYFQGDVSPGTKDMTAGFYTITVFANDGAGRRKTVEQFALTVYANLDVGGIPSQPHCVQMLAIIQNAILARVSGNTDGGVNSYQIDGVMVGKIPIETLERLRNKYAVEVDALQNPNGQIPRFKATFSPAGGVNDLRKRFGS